MKGIGMNAIKNITIPATLKTFSELAFFECYVDQ